MSHVTKFRVKIRAGSYAYANKLSGSVPRQTAEKNVLLAVMYVVLF